MSINAGTIVAYLTLDTNKFTSAVSSAKSQLKTLSDESATFSQKISAVGGSLSTVGMSLTKNVTAPILTLGIASSKFAISYEDAFAGVRKTLDATEEEYEQLSDSILRMASEMPTAAEDIAGVMEAAGQLGIQKENLESFTEVMVQLGDTTNLSADTAATTLARFANITGMSQENFDRLGSTIVDLGNNFATTEAEISDMALRIAGAGKQVGMSEADIMGVAAALSSVGLEAEAGGTAISKVLTDMSLAVEKGVNSSNTSLANFAKVAGMTSEEFAAAFKDDAAGALSAFIVGLGSLEEDGGSAIAVLDEMGITEVRMRDALLRSSGAADTFTSALQTASNAWEENTALTTEAEKRYETTASQLKILWNQIKALGIQFGEILLPYIRSGITYVGKLVTWFGNLNGETKKVIVNVSLVVAAIGPVITVIGRLFTAVGKFSSSVKAATSCLKSLTSAIVQNPWGLALTAISVGFIAVKTTISSVNDEVDRCKQTTAESASEIATSFSNVFTAGQNFLSSIHSGTSTVSDFGKALETNVNSEKITAITEKASSERRALTDKEISRLDKYYDKLQELTDQQYQAMDDQLNALSTYIQYEDDITSERAEKYLSEANAIRKESLELAEQAYREELALIATKYDKQGGLESEAAQAEIESAKATRDARISYANDTYASITKTLSSTYADQSSAFSDAMETVDSCIYQIEQAYERNDEFAKKMSESPDLYKAMFGWIDDSKLDKDLQQRLSLAFENFNNFFDESQQLAVSNWLAMVAEADLMGAELDEETQEILDKLILCFAELTPEAREAMKTAWAGMKEEMAAAEPELYATAESNADSIINTIDSALDGSRIYEFGRHCGERLVQGEIDGTKAMAPSLYDTLTFTSESMQGRFQKDWNMHSPSKVTHEYGVNIMLGLKNGIDDEKDGVFNSFSDTLTRISEKAGSLNLESAGANAMEGLRLGMKKKKNSLLETAGNIANSIGAKIRSAFDIHSPSRVMAAIGAQVSAGLAVGMEEYAYTVKDAAGSLASIATDTVDTATRNTITSGSITSSRKNTVERKLDNVIDLLNQLLLIRDGDVVMDGRVFGRWVREVIT